MAAMAAGRKRKSRWVNDEPTPGSRLMSDVLHERDRVPVIPPCELGGFVGGVFLRQGVVVFGGGVVNAVIHQTKLLQHATTIYLHHAIPDYAEELASKMPANLKVVYFVNSGCEANELAMLMARLKVLSPPLLFF